MPDDVPPPEWNKVDFRIEKTDDGTLTSFSDLKKYLEFDFISEEDARGVLEWFRVFYWLLVAAYQTWEVVELDQAIYLRDTYNDLAHAYQHVRQFVPEEKTILVPLNGVPDAIDAIKKAFADVWTSNYTGENNPLLEG